MKRFKGKCPKCKSEDLDFIPCQIPDNEYEVRCNNCNFRFIVISLDFIKGD